MGIILTGFPDDSSENRRRGYSLCTKDKKKLLKSIANHVNELRTGYLSKKDIRIKTIKNATPNQKIRILRKLEEECEYWGRYPAPIEQSIIEQAVREFKQGNYSHKTIYRYISAKDIDEIVSS